jgi:asparagine synthase (glutamine-hydrolysing)
MCGITVRSKLTGIESKITYRGPDFTKIVAQDEYYFIFHRLAIIDITSSANQPFNSKNLILVCNGEIFNYNDLRKKYSYNYMSESDCEVILAMFDKLSLDELCNELDGEFAFVLYDKNNKKVYAARDPIGIRPLFYGYTNDNNIAFSSELKDLVNFCGNVYAFPPGNYFDGKSFIPYCELHKLNKANNKNFQDILFNINFLLRNAVEKRLDADVPIGFLLSGGLDSSLVCALAAEKINKSIITFAIGLEDNPIDLKYASIVSKYIGSEHHEIIFSYDDIKDILEEVIWHTETWDITTIRASIPMFLLCRYIKKNTKIKVILTGEVSDELFGYKYTDYAPDENEFQEESQKRIRELYMYDVLRADRCIAGNGLEARVPFADKYFIEYVMNIDPKLKLNTYGIGKYLLRQSFINDKLLPDEILFRDKAAFSDAVGHGLVDYLQKLSHELYTDDQFEILSSEYQQNKPLTKEALMYRKLFNKLFDSQDHIISSYWLPNLTWPNCNLIDPSARFLPNYGLSYE